MGEQRWLGIAVAVATIVAPGLAAAQCTKDTDCKGERICVEGGCVDAPVAWPTTPRPNVLAPAHAAHLMQAAQLRQEVAELRDELQDSGLGSPILKMVIAVPLILAAGLLGNSYANTNDSAIGGAGLLCLVAGGAAALWGIIQLALHLRARSILPELIAEKEQQATLLEQEQ